MGVNEPRARKASAPKHRKSRLSSQHLKLIEESGISRDVAGARGYRSVKNPAILRTLGFNELQSQLVPGLLIPIHDIHGNKDRFQLRPDKPRLDHQSGRPRKYENLPGVGVALDVHPKVRRLVKDVSLPLYITEGVRKGDAGVTLGLAIIALYSVWNWRGTDESGALMVLAEWDEIPLKGRTVYVVFDSDVMSKRSVKLALERLGRMLARRGAAVRYVYLPPGDRGNKQGLDDWFFAGNTVEELQSLAEDRIRGLPEVVVNGRQLREMTMDAVAALGIANDPPQLYRWSQSLARIRIDENGRPFVEAHDVASLKGRMTDTADFFTIRGDKRIHATPPEHVARDVLAMPEWDFPVLEAVVETPTVREGGLILDEPGYDPATRLVYVPPPEFVMPKVPAEPSSRWVIDARKLLLEVFRDFPFVDEASRANALALLLTPMLRPAINGPVPMALLDAPQAGTGKSLIAEAVALVSTGRSAEMMSHCRDDEEWRKQITSTLIKGPALVVIDNLMGIFRSAAIARALTATMWKDRILGQSHEAVLPQRATWIATGNNIILGGDLPRRTYLIRLDAQSSRPWLRDAEFLHPDLLAWIRSEREMILAALLTLARAWYASGCPASDTPMLGGFEDWCRVIGGVLANAGVKDFLGNLEESYESLDPGEDQWEGFLEVWEATFETRRVHARDVFDESISAGPLRDALPDELAIELGSSKEGSFIRKLGWSLRNHERRRYGEAGLYVLGERDKRTKTIAWRVVRPD